ncbi:peroxidase 18-like isoform X3 [Aristolochia californica]|uniref:peroxidase 18-like isoform X3 n=1 Tax=Aristolochia californica TaxID=171875 RepID=UPI0035E1B38D
MRTQSIYITTIHFPSLLSLVLFSFSSSSSPAKLSFDFYSVSCPDVERHVKDAVKTRAGLDPSVPGKFLRLVFHDCMVEGCDGSILLEGDESERSDPANASLGGFSEVEGIKRLLEIFCPGTVSCADVLALAARDAVEMTGGPSVKIPLGRRDGRVSAVSNVRINMVDTSFTLDQMAQTFSSKGLSVDDLVTLSGAHTIGVAHCSAFSERFKEDSQGKLTLIDPSLNESYAAELRRECPAGASSSTIVSNDPETSHVFDNQYYRNLLVGKGLFQSDSALLSGGRTKEKVELFSNGQESFFQGWGESFVKLTAVDVKTGDEGEIRRSCGSVNG